MPTQLRLLRYALAVASLLAMGIGARAAKPVWAGGGGNAGGNTWNTGTGNVAVGTNDVAQVSNHTDNPHVVRSLTFGGLEVSDGIIDGAGSLTLSLATATSLWTGGEFSAATIEYQNNLNIGAGNSK